MGMCLVDAWIARISAGVGVVAGKVNRTCETLDLLMDENGLILTALDERRKGEVISFLEAFEDLD